MNTARTFLPFLAALALGVCLAGCEGDPAGEEGQHGQLPDHEIDGFSLTQTRGGEKQWTLSAARALIYEAADRVEMTDVRIDYFDDEGAVESTMTAREGLLMRRTNNMEARRDVAVFASDGTILTTDLLTWNEQTGKIETDLPVRVTKGKDVFTGTGVTADPDLKNIKVKSNFKAFVKTPEGDLVEDY